MLHSSLADAMATPPPWGLGGIATFLTVAALMLAAAVSIQPHAVGAVTAKRTTVVIADDHRLILLALREELEAAGFDVCGEATSGADALDRVLESHPDLALLDEEESAK